MALVTVPALKFKASDLFGTRSNSFNFLPLRCRTEQAVDVFGLNVPEVLQVNPYENYITREGTSWEYNFISGTHIVMMPFVIEARNNTRKESAKTRNLRLRRKFNGAATKPRLSVFCSDKQLYAVLVDDQKKKCLFYGSTLQKSIRDNPPCSTAEAAKRVGEELVKACVDLKINEISSFDRNGSSRGERMQAFETAISQYGLLMR